MEHGLGAAFTDVNGDGRADLYVANDLDPNRLYVNVRPTAARSASASRARGRGRRRPERWHGSRRRRRERRRSARPLRDELPPPAARRLREPRSGLGFADARPGFAQAFDTTLAGWGASWADLDLDGRLDLALANGAIPVTDLAMDAEPVKVLGGPGGEVADVSAGVGLGEGPLASTGGAGRADYDNDGDLDLAVGSIGGPLVLLRNSGAEGHWLEVELRPFAPGQGHGGAPRRAQARPGVAGRGELPVLRGSAHPLRARGGDAGTRAGRPLPERAGRSPSNVAVDRAVGLD